MGLRLGQIFNELEGFSQPSDVADAQNIGGSTDIGTLIRRISAGLGPAEAQAAAPTPQPQQAIEQDPNFDSEFDAFEKSQSTQPEQAFLSADPEIVASPDQQFENNFAQFETPPVLQPTKPQVQQANAPTLFSDMEGVSSLLQRRNEMLKTARSIETSPELSAKPPMDENEGLDFLTNIKMGLFNSDEGKFKFLEHIVGEGKVRLEDSEFEVFVDDRWQPVIGDGLNSIVDLSARVIGEAPQIVGSGAGSAFGAAASIPTTGALAVGAMMAGGSAVGSMAGDIARSGIRYILGIGEFEPLDDVALEQIFARGMVEGGLAGVVGTATRGIQIATGANVVNQLFKSKMPRTVADLPEGVAELPGQPGLRTSGKQLREEADQLSKDLGFEKKVEMTPKQLTTPAPAGPNFAALAESKIMENPQEYPKFIRFAVKQTRQLNRMAKKLLQSVIPEQQLRRGKNLADAFHNKILERSNSIMNEMHAIRRMAHKKAQDSHVTFPAPNLRKKLNAILEDAGMLKAPLKGVKSKSRKILPWTPGMNISKDGYNKLAELHRFVESKSIAKRVDRIGARKTPIDPKTGQTYIEFGDFGEKIPLEGFTIEELFNIKNQIYRGTRINPLTDDTVTKHTKKVIAGLYGSAKEDFMQSMGSMIDDPHVTNRFMTITKKFANEADDIAAVQTLVQNNKTQLAAALVGGDTTDLANVLLILDDEKLHRSIAFDFLNNLITDTRLRSPGKLGRIGPEMFARLEKMNRTDPGKLEAIFGFGNPTSYKNAQGKTLREGEALLLSFKKFASIVARLEAIDISKAGAKNTVEAKAVETAMAPWSRFFGVKALVHFLAGYPKTKEYLTREGFDRMLQIKIPKKAIGAGLAAGQVGGQVFEESVFNPELLPAGTQFEDLPQELEDE